MARYKDPEERLEDIEKYVKSIKHTVDSMQRRAMIMTILRLIRLAIIAGIIIYLYYGLQPFIEGLGSASIKYQEDIQKVQELSSQLGGAVDTIKGFVGGGE